MVKWLMLFFITGQVFLVAQNKQTIDEKSGKSMLMGVCNRDAFKDTSYLWWFDSNYKNYTLDEKTLSEFPADFPDITIKIIMGSWCSDSREQVPAFYRILDYIKFPQEKLSLICVDRNKHGEKDEVEGLNIELVPTIIVSRGENEIGRIIETPKESLEKDLLKILQ